MAPRKLRKALAHVMVTLSHKVRVGRYMLGFAARIFYRAICHDNSKLCPPELAIFADADEGPYAVSYGSKRYFDNLDNLSAALLHHYAHNSHHPEHYETGVSGMNLLDLVEMVSDWRAASSAQMGSSVKDSVQDIVARSQNRFGMSDDLSAVLRNSMLGFRRPRPKE